MSIGRRIAHARKEVSLSQQAVADRFGISRAAVAQWESGDTHPGMTKLEGLAQVLDVRLEWLATGKGAKHVGGLAGPLSENQRAAPLLSWEASMAWPERTIPPGGAHPPLVTRAETGVRVFALAIEDESMSPEFTPGDHVIVDPDVIPQAGDFVVARSADDDTPTLRLYRALERHDAEAAELVPLNAAWPTRQIDRRRPGHIVGTMVEHRRYRRS
jgi:SOS-response transcriptional repressor LexA